MGKKPVVALRVYRGRQMSYDAQGNVQNENQLVKLTHDTVEWRNFMKNITANGYLKVDVESVKFLENNRWVDGKKDIIAKEVEMQMRKQTEVPMSAADKKIADLQAKVDALLKLQEDAVIVETPVVEEKKPKEDKKERENLRIEYAELNGGKKAFPAWSADKLREKIVELKAKA